MRHIKAKLDTGSVLVQQLKKTVEEKMKEMEKMKKN
jgi:hypothetical protein